MTISCNHPRPALVLPSYTPPKLNWQVPALLPDIPPNSARAILEALRGIYNEMLKRFAEPTIVPLVENIQAKPGQVIKGVGAGQTITLVPPGPSELLDPIVVVLTAVSSPVTVAMPDGTTVTLKVPGVYTVLPDSDGSYQVPPGDVGLLGIQGVSAGTQMLTSGTLSFVNSNGASFGLSQSSLLTMSYDGLRAISDGISQLSNGTVIVQSGFAFQVSTVVVAPNVKFQISNGSLLARAFVEIQGAQAYGLSFNNSNGVSFGASTVDIATLGRIINFTASAAPQLGLLSHIGGSSVTNATRLAFSNANGVSFTLSTAASAATLLASVAAQTSLSFSNTNGVSFGIAGSTLTASANDQSIGLVSHVGGNSVSAVTRLAFSNASNVTWSLSTAAGGATVIASVAAAAAGANPLQLTNSASSVSATQLLFSDANGFSWLLSTAASAATLSGSFAAIKSISAGAGNITNGALAFADNAGAAWGIAGSTITLRPFVMASDSVSSVMYSRLVLANSNNVSLGISTAASIATLTASFALRASAGASSADVSNLVFTNTNNVGFALSTNAAGATVRAAASINISAGANTGAQSVLSFADGSGVSFGLNLSTITASVAPQIGVVSHIGGNVVSSVTRLAFSNASNVTFSLSTAANAATVLASVAAGAAGGVALADVYGNTVTGGTVVLSVGANSTISNLWSAGTLSNNVNFGFNGSSITAQALIRVSDDSNGSGNAATRINFLNANGISWGMSTAQSAAGDRMVNITASQFVPSLLAYQNWVGNDAGAFAGFAANNGTQSSVWFGPLHQQGLPMPGNITANTLGFMISNAGAVSSNSTWGLTIRLGLYTLVNSTQLSLVNSVLHTQSATTQGTAQRNAEQTGRRFVSIHSSQWSAQPVLSYGVHYWLAYVHTQQNLSGSIMMAPAGGGGNYFGFLGESVSATFMRFPMFGGALSTTNIPGSIGATQILTQTSIVVNSPWSNAYRSVPVISIAQSYKIAYP